jgi:hypothetical protein
MILSNIRLTPGHLISSGSMGHLHLRSCFVWDLESTQDQAHSGMDFLFLDDQIRIALYI